LSYVSVLFPAVYSFVVGETILLHINTTYKYFILIFINALLSCIGQLIKLINVSVAITFDYITRYEFNFGLFLVVMY